VKNASTKIVDGGVFKKKIFIFLPFFHFSFNLHVILKVDYLDPQFDLFFQKNKFYQGFWTGGSSFAPKMDLRANFVSPFSDRI
jgi:hypothetical protein